MHATPASGELLPREARHKGVAKIQFAIGHCEAVEVGDEGKFLVLLKAAILIGQVGCTSPVLPLGDPIAEVKEGGVRLSNTDRIDGRLDSELRFKGGVSACENHQTAWGAGLDEVGISESFLVPGHMAGHDRNLGIVGGDLFGELTFLVLEKQQDLVASSLQHGGHLGECERLIDAVVLEEENARHGIILPARIHLGSFAGIVRP
jgi:hypothetical protein